MSTSAISSISGTQVILMKDSSAQGAVKCSTVSTMSSYINSQTHTGAINNSAIQTSGTATTVKGGLTGTSGGNVSGFGRVYNAVWNDYADFIKVENFHGVPGKCYYVSKNGEITTTDRYCQKGTLGIHSDTFGYCPGGLNPERDHNSQGLVLGVAGFVLAYVDNDYATGTPLCSGANGYLTKMKIKDRILHPERLVGVYFRPEKEKTYNGVLVKDRAWIKIK